MHSQNYTVAAALIDVVCSAVIRINSAEEFYYVPLISDSHIFSDLELPPHIPCLFWVLGYG